MSSKTCLGSASPGFEPCVACLPPRRVMAATRVLAIDEEPPVGKKAPPCGVWG